jgi:hypothetical protein
MGNRCEFSPECHDESLGIHHGLDYYNLNDHESGLALGHALVHDLYHGMRQN